MFIKTVHILHVYLFRQCECTIEMHVQWQLYKDQKQKQKGWTESFTNICNALFINKLVEMLKYKNCIDHLTCLIPGTLNIQKKSECIV